jgi:hypothetical protein
VCTIQCHSFPLSVLNAATNHQNIASSAHRWHVWLVHASKSVSGVVLADTVSSTMYLQTSWNDYCNYNIRGWYFAVLALEIDLRVGRNEHARLLTHYPFTNINA